MKNLEILHQRILGGYKTVAVVGNAGVNQSDDQRIRDCSRVVRFNNYATRAGISYTEDPYRCDILFSTFDLHSKGSNPKDVVIGIPFPFKAAEIYNKPAVWYPKSSIWTVNPYENMRMCHEMDIKSDGFSHPIPSIGFTALWHMMDWVGVEFYICGFEWYFNEATGLFQNFRLDKNPKPSTWNHDYHKEIKFILEHIRPKNNINFSDRCNKLLDIAADQLKRNGI